MRFDQTAIPGLLLISFDPQIDDRGSFMRIYDREALRQAGCETDFPVHAIATNPKSGTLRGLHYQVRPYTESKIIRCSRGSVWDVILDVRRSSPTFGTWQAFTLDHAIPKALYVEEGLAHGYATLTDNADVHYLLSGTYSPDHAAGCRWNDPALSIPWPVDRPIMNDRDERLPLLSEARDPYG